MLPVESFLGLRPGKTGPEIQGHLPALTSTWRARIGTVTPYLRATVGLVPRQ